MKLLFLGSGAFGLPTLRVLREAHTLAAVISQPDKPAGRKKTLTPTPVSRFALEEGLPLLRTDDVNTPSFIEQVGGFQADAAVVIAFGQKLGPPFIDALGRLAVNLHASLLPRYRGAAPINWAMIRNEHETGVCVIGLAQKMDAGDVYAAAATPIDPMETAGELHDRLAELGPATVLQVLEDLEHNRLHPRPQDHDAATLAPKLKKHDGTVDFSQPAFDVRARIHGLTPWPGCQVLWRSSATGKTQPLFLRRVSSEPDDMICFPGLEQAEPRPEPGLILPDARVAVADGALQLRELQLPGKRLLPIAEFTRGHPLHPGDQLIPMAAD